MATWRDGPRYAPTTRPRGFAAPSQAIGLEPAKACDKPAEVLPAAAPSDFQAAAAAVPLANVTAVRRETRDPHQPFTTLSSAMTAPTWTSDPANPATNPTTPVSVTVNRAVQRTPYQPFTVASTGTAFADAGFAAPTAEPPVRLRPAPLGACWTAGYPPLLICLIVCGFIALSEYWLPAIYLIAAPWLMVPQVHRRVRQVKTVAWFIVGVLVALWITSLILDASFYNVDLGLGWWTAFGCWGLAVADLLLQRAAIRRGEPRHNAQSVARPKININQASAATLETLPAVGPVIARAIVDWRQQHGPFTSVTQLQYVRGIGPNNYAQIEAHVTI